MTKVLIVEDDVAFALMLRTWLSKNGYEAESVVSAEQAVKRMGECVFDVVLSDCACPTATASRCSNGYGTNRLTAK